MIDIRLNLQRFAEEGAGMESAPAAGAETAAAETAAPAETTPISAGDTLPDGTRVQNARVAAALEKQMKRHPELRGVYGQAPKQQTEQGAEPAEKTIQERWEDAKRGEFAELYGQDVQNAIRDRFKNQADVSEQLNALEPMLAVLRERAGVESNDDLIRHVMDDDSLYEEEADEAGMTVSAYRTFKELEAENREMREREEQTIQEQMFQDHFSRLVQQAEDLKQRFPGFDLREELKNQKFFQLTSPEVGVSVEDAFFAVHHRDLAPQMLAYGMERAKQQMGQTLQAQRNRPAEGAMKAQGGQAAALRMDPRNMTRAERAEIKRQVRMGKRVSFD